MPISRQPLILPSDEPIIVRVKSIPFVCNHSDILPSKIPAMESDMALHTTAPAKAPTAPKSWETDYGWDDQ